MNVGLFGRDESDKKWYTTEQASLLFDRVTIVAQMLQISSCICLHNRIWIVEERDYFVKVRISPSNSYFIIKSISD